MEQKNVKSNKKIIIVLTAILLSLIVAFTAVTLAWFTDSESFNSSITFGEIEIDTEDATNPSSLSYSVTRNIGDYINGGKVMPGDTISFNLTIKLTNDSEPAYYLVKVAGTGALSSLTTTNYYFYDSTAQGNLGVASSSNKVVGSINPPTVANDVVTATNAISLVIPFVISTDFTEQGATGNITCTVAAVQQANVGYSNGYSSMTPAEQLEARNEAAYDILDGVLNPTPVVEPEP